MERTLTATRLSAIVAITICIALTGRQIGLFGQLFGSKPKPDVQAFQQLVDQSIEELKLKTTAHDGVWHIGESKWDVDQVQGTIVFTSPNGTIATCDVQIIGTRNDDDGSWMWGWDHPSVPVDLQRHAKQVRDYGLKHNFPWLTTQMIECPEDKAWQLAALACKLNSAQGAYRGPAGNTAVYMTFDNIRLTKPE